jgi:S-DNA-T family DNA segregation ATPase FtsK/SpoIIIE
VAFEIDSRVSREVWGVIWIIAAVFLLFALNDTAGPFGMWTKDSILKPFFGVGAPLIPVLFFVMGATQLFFESMAFRGARLFGLILMWAAGLGMFHLTAPTDAMFESASEYGGYVGFVTSFIAMNIFGSQVTAFILAGLVVVSIFLVFHISLKDVLGATMNFLKAATPAEADTRVTRSETIKKQPKASRSTGVADEDEDDEVTIIRGIEKAIEKAATQQVVATPVENISAATHKSIAQAAIPKIQDNTAFSTEKEAYTSKDYTDWKLPPFDLLLPQAARGVQDDDKLLADADIIRKKLSQFNLNVTMKDVNVGPTVIQYTLKPAEDVKVSKITSLKNDLALALAAQAIRIEAPVPGKSLVGIEIPTQERATVMMRDILESKDFSSGKDPLKLVLGRDVTGKAIIASLAKMPHLLVAGQTGSGKSVAVNSFMISLMYQHSPADLKMILVDPKRVEMEGYNGIPHLLTPVITEPEKALKALKWAVAEMTRRYKELSHKRKRNLVEYNADSKLEKMPYIVIVIDELADLMMAASKEIEATICRLAQMARAVGIHLIIATQRPSVDVITGLIKANIPTRIAFTVATGIDSRTILDGIGAEDLLNKGDMLYLASDFGKPMRVQGVFASSEEIDRVINHIKLNAPEAIEYVDEIIEGDHKVNIPGVASMDGGSGDDDLQKAIEVIKQHRKASASLLQRRCSFGYAKAARVLDELEEMGMIGPSNGAKPREIFLDAES